MLLFNNTNSFVVAILNTKQYFEHKLFLYVYYYTNLNNGRITKLKNNYENIHYPQIV